MFLCNLIQTHLLLGVARNLSYCPPAIMDVYHVARVLRLFDQQLVARRDSQGTGILFLWDFCSKTMQAIMEQPKNKKIEFQFPSVSPGEQLLSKEHDDSGYQAQTYQSHTQSPQAFWSVSGHQERLWRTRKNLNVMFKFFYWLSRNSLHLFYHTNPGVIKFQFPRVSPGDQPLAKEPEDSGYEYKITGKTPNHISGEMLVLIQYPDLSANQENVGLTNFKASWLCDTTKRQYGYLQIFCNVGGILRFSFERRHRM